MKPQHTQSAPGQGDWDRERNEIDPRTGASSPEHGRPYQRSAPENYPESQQQYQGQRDHPGIEYFAGSTGYGGRGDYPQQQGQGGFGQQQGYGGYGREEQGRPSGGQFGSGQHREAQPSQYGRGGQQQDMGYGETGRWNSGYSQTAGGQRDQFQGGPSQGQYGGHQQQSQFHGYGGQMSGQAPAGQASRFGGQYPEHPQQGYGGFQGGQPGDYGNQQSGQFFSRGSHETAQQPSGGYGSYGAYQVGSQPQNLGRSPRAPKDYTRSDERIRELICEHLAHHPSIDASEVSVQVSQGRVTLDGSVPERRMKHEIEDVADGCWGVKDVENRIRVQSGQQSGLNNPAQGWLVAPADVLTGGASTEAAAGKKTRVEDMAATETGGSSLSDAGSSGKPGEMQSKDKGK